MTQISCDFHDTPTPLPHRPQRLLEALLNGKYFYCGCDGSEEAFPNVLRSRCDTLGSGTLDTLQGPPPRQADRPALLGRVSSETDHVTRTGRSPSDPCGTPNTVSSWRAGGNSEAPRARRDRVDDQGTPSPPSESPPGRRSPYPSPVRGLPVDVVGRSGPDQDWSRAWGFGTTRGHQQHARAQNPLIPNSTLETTLAAGKSADR